MANTVDMERHAREVERMAEAGMERSGWPPIFIPPPPVDSQFPVFSPVDGTFASWDGGGGDVAVAVAVADDDEKKNDDDYDHDDDVDEDYSRRRGSDDDGLLDAAKNSAAAAAAAAAAAVADDDDFDVDVIDESSAPPPRTRSRRGGGGGGASASAARRMIDDDRDYYHGGEEDDDALARAIAEQDLPPGVSVAEQQEVMMRLLTQRIRRGDHRSGAGGEGGGEPLSPALEARLRDFNFAQRKRRETYGDDRPWGILGLYDHLSELIRRCYFWCFAVCRLSFVVCRLLLLLLLLFAFAFAFAFVLVRLFENVVLMGARRA
jgi:hypothetical protein